MVTQVGKGREPGGKCRRLRKSYRSHTAVEINAVAARRWAEPMRTPGPVLRGQIEAALHSLAGSTRRTQPKTPRIPLNTAHLRPSSGEPPPVLHDHLCGFCGLYVHQVAPHNRESAQSTGFFLATGPSGDRTELQADRRRNTCSRQTLRSRCALRFTRQEQLAGAIPRSRN